MTGAPDAEEPNTGPFIRSVGYLLFRMTKYVSSLQQMA